MKCAWCKLLWSRFSVSTGTLAWLTDRNG